MEEKTTKSILDTPIEELELSIRSYNCLKRANLHTVGDLGKLTEEDFLKVRNLGRKSIDEVIAKLSAYGVEISDRVSPEFWVEKLKEMKPETFKKGSETMERIKATLKSYVDELQEKMSAAKTVEEIKKYEERILSITNSFEEIVSDKVALTETLSAATSKISSKMKDIDVKYHHRLKNDPEHKHSHNPFVNDEREL